MVTGGPTSTPHTLQLAAHHISTALSKSLKLPSIVTIYQPQPNVKWSKLLINSVPTSASESRPPSSPEDCHQVLAATNPSYASLTVTWKPSWVCTPSSYKPGSISSLSVAFEDPDGSKLKAMLAERYLYIYGNRASVQKWKHHQKINKDKSDSNTTKHNQGNDPNGKEDTKATLSPGAAQLLSQPPSVSTPPVTNNPNRKPSRACH